MFKTTAFAEGGVSPRLFGAGVLALSLLLFACSSDDESSDDAADSETVDEVSTDDGSDNASDDDTSDEDEQIPGPGDFVAAANGFATAWETGDWDTAQRLSGGTVVSVAQEVYTEGVQVEVVPDDDPASGEMLVTDPEGGPALAFTYSVGDSSGTALVDSLVPGDNGG